MNAMPTSIKQAIALFVTVFILGIAYYGNYLPLRKSESFIEATRQIGSARSLNQFQAIMAVPLDGPSPIGQEELVRNLASFVTDILRSPSGRDPHLTEAILTYLYKYYDPIIKHGTGMSFEQNLYVLGLANQLAYVQTHEDRYLKDSENFYLMGNQLAPKRPQPLYGLFDIYRLSNNIGKAKEVSIQILKLWPEDTQVRTVLGQIMRIETGVPAPTASPKK